MAIGNDREIRPDRTIQKTLSNDLNHRRDAENIHPVPFFPKNEVVCKKWNSHDMVKMRMGDEDMFDSTLPFDIKKIGQTSCIE